MPGGGIGLYDQSCLEPLGDAKSHPRGRYVAPLHGAFCIVN